MDELERRKFKLHSETGRYRRRVQKAEEWIHEIFDRYENPCLNFSGGKDSLVLLHLVSQRCGYTEVDVYNFDNGVLEVPGNQGFVERSVQRLGGVLYQRSSENVNSREMVMEEGHGYNGFWGWYRRLSKQHSWDIRLLGIRAAESRERRDRFDSSGRSPPINTGEEYVSAAPIHHFTTRDVWAYIVANGVEYHDIYDKQGELYGSMEADGNRLVTIYDSEFDSLGARTISQFIYPGKTNDLKNMEND